MMLCVCKSMRIITSLSLFILGCNLFVAQSGHAELGHVRESKDLIYYEKGASNRLTAITSESHINDKEDVNHHYNESEVRNPLLRSLQSPSNSSRPNIQSTPTQSPRQTSLPTTSIRPSVPSVQDFTAQAKALAVVPKITGFISALFSFIIVCVVLRSPKRRKQTYHRMMGMLSLVDFSTSVWMALSTWPVPRDEPPQAVFATGTEVTCTVQAFFIHLSVTSILYNASLSFFYLFVVRFGWKNHSITRIEPLLHGIPLLWGIGTAVAAYCLGAFKFAGFWCWIGKDYSNLRMAFLYGPLFLTMVVVFINNYMTWLRVHEIEARIDKYTFRDTERSNPGDVARRKIEFKKSRKLANQCFLYAGGFYVAWFFLALIRLLQLIGITKPPFALLLPAVFFAPMQGLPNILTYLLPEARKLQRKNGVGIFRGFFQAVVHQTNSVVSNVWEHHHSDHSDAHSRT